MSDIITFSSRKILTEAQQTKVKPDGTGYYPIILSAFDVRNEAGTYYHVTDKLKKIFEPGSILRRRLDNGYCKGEVDHPNISGMNREAALRRIADIDGTRVCCHFKSVTLKQTKDEFGKDILVAVGMTKPSGPYADSLKASFDNVEENVAFSARFFHRPLNKRGIAGIEVTSILTWDHIGVPNISVANKFATASMDGFNAEINDLIIEQSVFDNAMRANSSNHAMDDFVETIRMVRNESMDWQQVSVLTPRRSSLDWK